MLGSMLGGSWVAGMVMHFVNGSVVFPAVYVYALYAHLPGAPAVRGTAWGVVLWFVAQTVVMPNDGRRSVQQRDGRRDGRDGITDWPRSLWKSPRDHRQRRPVARRARMISAAGRRCCCLEAQSVSARPPSRGEQVTAPKPVGSASPTSIRGSNRGN